MRGLCDCHATCRFVWAFPFLFISVVVAVFFWSRTAIALVALLTALSFLPPGDVRFAPCKESSSASCMPLNHVLACLCVFLVLVSRP